MKNYPLISIALCTYNGEAFLEEQLESLVSQSYPNLEIRIRDDKSTDKTWQIIQDFKKRYDFIHAIQNDVQLGFQKNFETVFQDCKGLWIAPSDQDDIWDINKILKLYLHTGNNILVYHDSELVDENKKSLGKRMSDKFNFVSGQPILAFLFFNCVSGHAMLFHRQLLDKCMPIPEVGFYDHWLAINALSIGTIGKLDEVLVKYRQHSNNQTDLGGKKKPVTGFERTKMRINRENKWLNVCKPIFQRTKFLYSIRLIEMANKRENNFLSLAFGLEIWKNRIQLLPIVSKGSLFDLLFAMRYSWGLKSKKLFHGSV